MTNQQFKALWQEFRKKSDKGIDELVQDEVYGFCEFMGEGALIDAAWDLQDRLVAIMESVIADYDQAHEGEPTESEEKAEWNRDFERDRG